MRVVLDTNVIVSGLFWKGAPKTLFDLIEQRKLTLCITPQIIAEVQRVLKYPKILRQLHNTGIEPNEVIGYVVKDALVFPDIDHVHIVKEDPSDDIFLNCAISCGAHWLITGDKHLLSIGNFGDIIIVTPAQFLTKSRLL
jgi:putative PIN family toxin of toxin-antitoxin system